MKYKKLLILLCSVVFFLTALTFYLNRVIFPGLIKNIAIQQIETTLKRKAQIDTIHFNWFKGIIIENIRIYEKDSPKVVFARADQISFGFILIPGLKHYKITIPFIHVSSPSVHLVRTAENVWNFSDIQDAPSSVAAKPQAPSAFDITWGGITITDGQALVEDLSSPRRWSELFNNINLKLSLSYKGISYDFTADIPKKNGSLGATVYYQPLTKNTRARIHLKNINAVSYLSLVKIPDIQLNSGLIKWVDLDINYDQEQTSAQGDVLITGLDIAGSDQTFKGDIAIHDLDAQYKNGDITARGQMTLNKVQTKVPGLFAGGSAQTKVNDFELSPEGIVFDGTFHAEDVFLNLPDRKISASTIDLDNFKLKKDKDGIQTVGSITAHELIVDYPQQTFKGDITLKPLTVRMKDENNITVEADIQAEHFSTRIMDKDFSSERIHLEDLQLSLTDQKNITLSTKMSLDHMTFAWGHNLVSSEALKADKFSLTLTDENLSLSTAATASQGRLVLDGRKTINASPRLELNLQLPLNAPQQATYKGSITFSDAGIRGFPLIPPLDNVELDADFQTDNAVINALSVNILDTNLQITGTVKNFKDPLLDINAQADELNLSKIRSIAPQIVDQFGLSFDGSSFVKVKFAGPLSNPLSGNIRMTASVKNVSIASSKWHQKISNITGIIESTNDSLKWRDFTVTYLAQPYSLTGSLDNFKEPRIFTILDGEKIQLKANMVKTGNLLTIDHLTGKYLNAAFDAKGTVTFVKGRQPAFALTNRMSMRLEDLINDLPPTQKTNILPFHPEGMLSLTADLKGAGFDWKTFTFNADITSPMIRLKGYTLDDVKISADLVRGNIRTLTLDGKFYDGNAHAVASLNLLGEGMPYDLALNINSTDLRALKMDSPFKMDEVNGKFYLTAIGNGTIADFKNKFHAKGSLAIREGFLTQFNVFKGLLSILNDSLHLGEVMITDAEGNFIIEGQKINTDNLRLKGPSIVLLGQGWVGFDQNCDLDMTVDLSSGVVPPIAQDVLKTLRIHVYDKITNPKYKKKISVPQVINTLFKNLLQ